MRKILFLGSTPHIAGMVNTARHMGLYTIVTDNKPIENAPAKLIADEYENISIADIPCILNLIRERNIDGVLTGFSDSYLEYYLEICEKANLPCYGDFHSFQVATNKMFFKEMCKESGVSVIPGVNARIYEDAAGFTEENGYPLLLKPVDNSGSRGVIKCCKADDLREAFSYAMSFSKSHNIICEKFMDCDCVCVSYQLHDGTAKLSSTCDKYNYVSETGDSNITGDLVYPSKYTLRYKKEIDHDVKMMLEKNGFHNGIVSLDGFVDENGFYMCEMCYRPSGGQHYKVIADQNGINGLKLLIEFAVTGKISNYNPNDEQPEFKDCYAMHQIIGFPNEKIAEISGIKNIRGTEGVIDAYTALSKGETIGKDGTTAQVIASIWLKAKDRGTLLNRVEKIDSKLVVLNESGNSLIKKRTLLAEKILNRNTKHIYGGGVKELILSPSLRKARRWRNVY